MSAGAGDGGVGDIIRDGGYCADWVEAYAGNDSVAFSSAFAVLDIKVGAAGR